MATELTSFPMVDATRSSSPIQSTVPAKLGRDVSAVNQKNAAPVEIPGLPPRLNPSAVLAGGVGGRITPTGDPPGRRRSTVMNPSNMEYGTITAQ